MEDACVVVDGFGGDAGTGYFGVYDGHGGRNVAEYLRLNLHNNVEKELRAKGDRSVEECLKAAFIATDMECSQTGEQASGSTSVVCMVRRQGPKRYVYTANCGDARAVLCHAGVAVRLSKDHKATDPAEKARIEAAGGFVVRKRVMGVLAVARAFGDFVLKKFVTAEPYTSTTKLDTMVGTQDGGAACMTLTHSPPAE
jgi:serine/threonine protein phosphatase PrpC